ncbi:hypothetical protein CAPTEDRAFT_189723 [Capitella teleta]|uniref:Uncharacterized protein n=1 Tax=Capitella teleta TaxID=283909 RepID=R7TCQ7_CAPTE|nr:hypothetical protein CAPTEDRAFT_189723 [Capitella teleta]|eukprot:ELT91282.1 hypothetical protein CAPTEDRAFT_189723 [Capitella teleta]
MAAGRQDQATRPSLLFCSSLVAVLVVQLHAAPCRGEDQKDAALSLDVHPLESVLDYGLNRSEIVRTYVVFGVRYPCSQICDIDISSSTFVYCRRFCHDYLCTVSKHSREFSPKDECRKFDLLRSTSTLAHTRHGQRHSTLIPDDVITLVPSDVITASEAPQLQEIDALAVIAIACPLVFPVILWIMLTVELVTNGHPRYKPKFKLPC